MQRKVFQANKEEIGEKIMNLVTYDLIFLAVFVVFIIIFLATRKKNLHRQGMIFLYKTQLGIRFMDMFAIKFKKILIPLQYVVIACGYFLMASIIWYFSQSFYLYFTTSISSIIKAPPVAPLIPYFPKIFGLESFFPPLYFTYFIIIIGVVAVVHEFSHGIFARLYNFKIHSTGFAFFGPIFGAFVEPDEKQMEKAIKRKQLGVLAAGTFANVLMTILFLVIMAIFFSSLFVQSGAKFNAYKESQIKISEIESVEDSDIAGFVKVKIGENVFYANIESLEKAREKNIDNLRVFDSFPAFESQLRGAIIEFDNEKIENYNDLINIIGTKNPGDIVKIKTIFLDNGRDSEVAGNKEYEIKMGDNNGSAVLGIGYIPIEKKGLFGIVFSYTFGKIKDQSTFYKSKIGEFGWFIYYLLWWMIVINLLVALFNMLPLGFLDGGKFFYLTVWGITGSEKIGKKAFSVVTWILLAMVVLLMLKWVFVVF